MNFNDYQNGTHETWNKDIELTDQINNAILGIMGELGEFCEIRKKWLFHNIEIDYNKERKELGDILYYLTILISLRGYNLEMIAEENLYKLKKRYPNGFVEGGGIR